MSVGGKARFGEPARTLEEFRKLEQKASLEEKEYQDMLTQRGGSPSHDKAGGLTTDQVVAATLHLAPLATSLAVKLAWDAAGAREGTSPVNRALASLSILLLVLVAYLTEQRSLERWYGRPTAGREVAGRRGGGFEERRNALVDRIARAVKALYGSENMRRAHENVRSLDECSSCISWICSSLGISDQPRPDCATGLESAMQMLERKLEQVEQVMGL